MFDDYFQGISGMHAFNAIKMQAIQLARAYCSEDEIAACIEGDEWPAGLIDEVMEVLRPLLAKARKRARAQLRIDINNASTDTGMKAPQISLLRELAMQELNWSRSPIDDEMARALSEADSEQGKKKAITLAPAKRKPNE